MRSLIQRFHSKVRNGPRLIGASAWALAVWLALPDAWTPGSRVLVAWNAAVWPYLASMAWLMFRAAPERVRAIAEKENASSAFVVAIVSAAAAFSLVAIAAELTIVRAGGTDAMFGYAVPLVTVTGSWFLLGVIYTFHYTHLFYEAPADQRPLRFPEGLAQPSYRDFLYFAFTIAANGQTSDIAVHSTGMRTAVLAHTVLTFFFNMAILGLAVNIGATAFGS